jgi:protein-S-isoprenylcysteine O-methyltransferase Ste14
MNSIGIVHVISAIFLTGVTAVVYSINMQGWRHVEPAMSGIKRRSFKILGLLLYLAIAVQFVTMGANREGSMRWIVAAPGFLMAIALLLISLFPDLFFKRSADDDTDDAKDNTEPPAPVKKAKSVKKSKASNDSKSATKRKKTA